MASKKKAAGVGPSKKTRVRIEPLHEGDFPSAYANFASVTHTKDDLCIDFCLLAPPHRVNLSESDDATAYVPVVSRVLIPTSMANGLIKALRAQADKAQEDSGGDTVIQVKESSLKKGRVN